MKNVVSLALKAQIKRFTLMTGLYRPARYINDLFYRRNYREAFRRDIENYRSFFPSGSLCFDIGANIGEKTGALLRAGMRVVAIEPQPDCVDEIRARCHKFPELQVCVTAVGDHNGTARLHQSDVLHSSSSLREDWTPSSKSFEVTLRTLDSLIDEFGSPYYCKIDVEGYELEVLSGLSTPIPVISFEYHMTEADLKKTNNCVQRISSIVGHQLRLNLMAAEAGKFAFSDWVTLAEFQDRFPAEFTGLSDFRYGDIWVKSPGE